MTTEGSRNRKNKYKEPTDRIIRTNRDNIPFEELVEGYSPLIGIFPEDFLKLVRDIDLRNLGVTIDFCHLWITYKTLREFVAIKNSRSSFVGVRTGDYVGLASYESDSICSYARDPFGSFLNSLGEKIVHIHLADTSGFYVPGRSAVSEGNPLGEGDLDLDSLTRWLAGIQLHPSKVRPTMIVLETKEIDLNEPVNSQRSLMKLGELLRAMIARE